MIEVDRVSGLRRCSPDILTGELAAILKEDGGLVITGLLSRAQVAQLEHELEPHVNSRQPGFRHFGTDGFYGGNTKRIQGLAAKSPEFVRSMLLNPY